MKEYIEIITGIVGILGSIIAIYKVNTSKLSKYLDRYYKSVLERFYLKCIIKGLDVKDFINREHILEKYYSVLPTYVIKLIHDVNSNNNPNMAEDKKVLYKILYVDFNLNRPSLRNSVLKSLTTIMQVINYIIELFFLLFTGGLGVTILFSIIVFIQGRISYRDVSTTATIGGMTIDGNVFQVLITLIIIGVWMVTLKVVDGMIKEYTYSLNVKVIDKQIKSKVNQYHKLKDTLRY